MRHDDGKLPAQRLNFVDRVVTFFSASAGVRRMQARQILHEFGYNDKLERRGGAGGQVKNANTESYTNQRDRIKAMWDARDQVMYTWIGGVIARIVLYVCGELSCKSNTGDDELDRLYDDYFHAWCGDEQDDEGQYTCDYSGRHRFLKLVQIAFMAMLVDGDDLLVIRRQEVDGDLPGEGTGTPCLQFVQADRIGSPIEAQQREDYVSGFTIEPRSGRVLSARIYRRTLQNQYVEPQEVEPANFMHVWDPEQGDAYRGRSALLRMLNDSRDLKEWDEAEMIAGKTQSQFAGLIGSKDPYAKTGAGAWEGKTKEGTPTQDAQWGKLLKMAEGDTFSLTAPPSRPSGGFLTYLQMKIRFISSSLKFSYGFVWDLATLGGVTARVEVRADERRINYFQSLLVDRILHRTRKIVLADGVAQRKIAAHPNMGKCTWHFGQRIITDVGYEVQNDLALANAGFKSWDDVATKYSEGGGDLRDILQRNAAINTFGQNLAASSGQPMEMLAPALWPAASQQLAAMNSEPSPPPKPGSMQAVGDKGAAQIIDLLSKVSTGQMEPEAARQTLVTVYGVSPELASRLVPDKALEQPKKDDSGGKDE